MAGKVESFEAGNKQFLNLSSAVEYEGEDVFESVTGGGDGDVPPSVRSCIYYRYDKKRSGGYKSCTTCFFNCVSLSLSGCGPDFCIHPDKRNT